MMMTAMIEYSRDEEWRAKAKTASVERREVEPFVEPLGFQCAQGFYPEVLPSEESVSYLFLRHGVVADFLDDDDSEIVKRVPGSSEMLVYGDRVFTFYVVSVLVYTSVRLLGLQFADVLQTGGTFLAPSQVYGVL